MPRIRLLRSSLKLPTYQWLIIGFGAGTASYYLYPSTKSSYDHPRHLNPSTFTPYTLISKTPVSSTSAVFTLKPQQPNDGSNSEILKAAFAKGIWSVQIKQPQLQIARNYTPLPPAPSLKTNSGDDNETGKKGSDDQIHLLIRREQSGEVSNYLHDLPSNSTIHLRGPFDELPVSLESTKSIIFLAGGTGIAPALQVAGLVAQSGRKDVKVTILWANRRREECAGGGDGAQSRGGWMSWFRSSSSAGSDLREKTEEKGEIVKLVRTLQDQTSPGQLSVDYFVDEEGSFIKPGELSKLSTSHTSKSRELDNQSQENSSGLIMISGPDGFMEYWAGRKEWVGGREVQGRLGGVLGKMNLKDWKVAKI